MTSSQSSFEVRVGSRIWLDWHGWDICELTGEFVRLRSSDSIRTVSISMLADMIIDPPVTGVDTFPAGAWEIPAVVLAGLTRAQQAQLSTKLATLRRVLEPDPDDARTILQRYEAEAAALGVSRRTLQRLASKLLEAGPSGLVDGRLLGEDRRSVDPRWDQACREVLDASVNASNPTRQWVISRANQTFLTAVPDGRVPSAAVAYRRVAELDKGRYTFGSAKQRRSVAKRPTGVLGRLRADRPGQYVLMDSYRLDVFAMEPVTLRWVNTELTVAMDLFDRCLTGLRLRPVAAQSPDVASVLFQTVTPQTWRWQHGSPEGPYGGLPDGIVLADPGGVLPDTIVVDHGKIYLSEHTRSVCERLGISIQPAGPKRACGEAHPTRSCNEEAPDDRCRFGCLRRRVIGQRRARLGIRKQVQDCVVRRE